MTSEICGMILYKHGMVVIGNCVHFIQKLDQCNDVIKFLNFHSPTKHSNYFMYMVWKYLNTTIIIMIIRQILSTSWNRKSRELTWNDKNWIKITYINIGRKSKELVWKITSTGRTSMKYM